MELEEFLSKMSSGSKVSELNPDNPWSWALKNRGDKIYPEIQKIAKELLNQRVSRHEGRKYSGGRDSISVIMTTFNSKNFMLPSIFSILKQTHSNLELIIVDSQ